MCWKIKNIEEMKHIQCPSDIVVYKIGIKEGDEFKSYYFDYFYKIGESKPLKKIYLERGGVADYKILYKINYGYHSYGSSIKLAQFSDNSGIGIYSSSNSKMLEGFMPFELLRYNLFIGRFIIPKGTRCFINKNDEYVSERIKFDGFVSDFIEITNWMSLRELDKKLKKEG